MKFKISGEPPFPFAEIPFPLRSHIHGEMALHFFPKDFLTLLLHPTITNCIISGNNGSRGAAISCDTSCSPTITNCTITGNVGTAYRRDLYLRLLLSHSVKNTILWGNTPNQIYFEPTPRKFHYNQVL